MGDKKKQVIACVLVITFILSATAAGSFVSIGKQANPRTSGKVSSRGGSQAVWEDDFRDSSKIDIGLSHNYVIDTQSGTVSMRETYPVWTNPSFTRMRPLEVSNTGGTPQHNYVLNITVYYDTDMQSDFDDLRFVDAQGVNLSYWISSRINGVSATVLVLVPTIPAHQNITLYLFYGNPSAQDQGNFNSVFTWADITDPDIMISFKAVNEGAWDPDVEYGGGKFLVAWEERIGPENIPLPVPNFERTKPGVIHGRTYNHDGGDPYPDQNSDIDISLPNSTNYHAENPSIAFGAGKFCVVWEENPANSIDDRYDVSIKGAFVDVNGNVLQRFNIRLGTWGQFNPVVTYDSTSNRFFVVWEDDEAGTSNYDIWGAIVTTSGTVLRTVQVTSENYCQMDPWICSDTLGHFMVVYETGLDPTTGPFSLVAKRFSSSGSQIGSIISIATGNSNIDYLYPAVIYNTQSQRYFVSWNDGNISQDPNSISSYDGNIWGKVLDSNGATTVNNFIITAGDNYIRTDVIPYFNTMFFISYNSNGEPQSHILGKLISSDGNILGSELMIDDGSSQNVDWNNLAVGEGRIFSVWEDERDQMSQYADTFGTVWTISQSAGSSDIVYTISYEHELITQAVLISTVITPNASFVRWHLFDALYETPGGTLQFDIVDANGTHVIVYGVDPQEDLANITNRSCRLQAIFTRTTPSTTPVLEKWNISWYMWADTEPPTTQIAINPAIPDGRNGWYVSPVTCTFTTHDNDSAQQNITTYYSINGGTTNVYNSSSPPVISSEQSNNTIEYWSEDNAGNRESPHHVIDNISIDYSAPLVSIERPPELVNAGVATVNGTAMDYITGSGIDYILIRVNDELVANITGNGRSSVFFETNFSTLYGETYEVLVAVYDRAGNEGMDHRTIVCSDRGIYQPGYIYLFDNPKLGPKNLLVQLGLTIVINYNKLYVALPNVPENATSVQFIIRQVVRNTQITAWDTNLTDGCTCEVALPFGMYEIHAVVYDRDNNTIADILLVAKAAVILLSSP